MSRVATAKQLLFLALGAALSACAGSGAGKNGLAQLDGLRGGMSRQEVIAVLGEPSTYSEIKSSPVREPYQEMTYVNTVVNPGVVELYFQPGLVEIRLDTKLYRDLSQGAHPSPVPSRKDK